jgi:hypothetical protein
MRIMFLVAVLTLAAQAGEPTEPALVQRGSGTYTYFWFSVYDLAFACPDGLSAADALGEHPRSLTFTYHCSCSVDEQREEMRKAILRRIGRENKGEIDAGLAEINALWKPIASGDVLELVYSPDTGTRVKLAHVDLGLVPGTAFARVLFSIWLGDDPLDRTLRSALLGQAR